MIATIAQSHPRETNSSTLSMPGLVGVYFGLRVCLTFLFFQSDPQTGTIVSLTLNLLLLVVVVFYSAGPAAMTIKQALRTWPFRMVLLFLMLALASLAWTEADSRTVAFGYWSGLAADVALAWLVLRTEVAEHASASLLMGFVWGACLLALVAWASPTMYDLRIGNDDFLSPNVIGFESALGVLFCQYLAPRGAHWQWLGGALGITLLRSLSKTSILAFIVAEVFFLNKVTTISRARKLTFALCALLVLTIFSGLFLAYYDIYTNAGDQAETLTGRTAIWLVALDLAIQKPWFGHGFHSFHTVVPTFGSYQAWHAHNELLHQFFNYGVTGVIVVIALYWSFYRQLRAAPSDPLRLLGQSLLVLVLVRGLVDTERFDLSLPLWTITAISLTLGQNLTQNRGSCE